MKHSLSMEESLAKYSQYDCEKNIFAIVFALQLWDVCGKNPFPQGCIHLHSRMYSFFSIARSWLPAAVYPRGG